VEATKFLGDQCNLETTRRRFFYYWWNFEPQVSFLRWYSILKYFGSWRFWQNWTIHLINQPSAVSFWQREDIELTNW